MYQQSSVVVLMLSLVIYPGWTLNGRYVATYYIIKLTSKDDSYIIITLRLKATYKYVHMHTHTHTHTHTRAHTHTHTHTHLSLKPVILRWFCPEDVVTHLSCYHQGQVMALILLNFIPWHILFPLKRSMARDEYKWFVCRWCHHVLIKVINTNYSSPGTILCCTIP